MSNIRVRVGQRQGVKIVASNKAGAFSIAASTDVNSDARADNTILMFDSATGKYIHVTPADVVDLVDGVEDDEVDFGEW
jgi:hypothetical protein